MATDEPLVEPIEPRAGKSLRDIASASLAGATATGFATLAFMFFIAYPDDRWSLDYLAYTVFALQLTMGAWALAIHTPLWLLVERRGRGKYLAMLIEVLIMLPVVALTLLTMGAFSVINFISIAALAVIPVLVLAGTAGLASRNDRMRHRGWQFWLGVTAAAFVIWFFSGVLPRLLG